MRKTLIPLFVLSLALIGAACDKDTNTNTTTNTTTNSTTNTSTNSTTNTSTGNTNSATNTNTGETITGSGAIRVTEPVANATVEDTFSVKGTAASGSVVYVRVISSVGNTIANQTVNVRNGSWIINRLTITTTNPTGTIEVYQKDGDEEVNLVRVPITFNASN